MEYTPQIFGKLLSEKLINQADILQSGDGFGLVFKSVADILAERGITDFPDSEGMRLECSKFYDDWFLYAVPDEHGFTYSLLKLREQEHDAEDGSPADGDTPGVTISFISFDCEILLACLENSSDENRMRLDGEINRVVCRRGQSHHKALKKYFIAPESKGAYLAASAYIARIASMAEKGCIDVPEHYKEIVQQSISYKSSSKNARLPRFIEKLNRSAGRTVCDNEKIYIKNPPK